METSKLITSLNKSGIGAYTELTKGDASINLSLAEFDQKRLIDMPYSFKDMISYLWNPYNVNGPVFSVDDTSILNDPSTLFVGAPLSHPFKDLKDIKWKLSNTSMNGVISTSYVTNPLIIYNNEIKFYNIFDSSSSFILNNTKVDIFIEEGFIRDAANNAWDAYQYSIYPNLDPLMKGHYIMESSLGLKLDFNGYILLYPDTSIGKIEYAYNDLYNVPLLTFNNFMCTDSSNNNHTLSTNYILDIKYGKIGLNDPCANITEYIKFEYDISINEQLIQHNIIYESNRMPICVVDPSIYYHQTTPNSNIIVTDNSVYDMSVNRIGDYNIEVYGWDSFNNIFHSQSSLNHRVWLQTPNIYTITDYEQNLNIDVSTISIGDVSTYINENSTPIYDRIYPMYGLMRKEESNNYYISVPSMTYFQDLPSHGSINKFYNLTERVLSKTAGALTVDINYQNFNSGDSVSVVKYGKGKYDYIDSIDVSIISVSDNLITVNNILNNFEKDSSTDIYLINTTLRSTSITSNYPEYASSSLSISNYVFKPSQIINLIITDHSTNYCWGASYKVIDVSADIHTLNGAIPSMFINNSRYTIAAKHAFTTYSSTDIKTDNAVEIGGEFKIFLSDEYNEEWSLDNTFAIINTLFDQTNVNLNWNSTLINTTDPSTYKKYYNPIIADTSSLVLLCSEFDNSTYLKNQKNIWTVRYNTSKDILFRVHNKSVPYKFSEKGYYDVQLESYDSYGNISTINNEGLIHII